VALANQGTYDLYLSLHSNASPEGSEGTLQGPDIYYFPTSVRGRQAAQIIEENLKEVYPTPELVNIIPSTYYYELRRSRAPAVLVEVAYHDNPDDANWITQNTDEIARALAMAVTEFLNVPFVEMSGVEEGTVRLTSGTLNIRSAPSTNSEIIGSANNGDRVQILQTLPEWYRINLDGLTGYANSRFIELD
jgi:N-acetylmuramoyl-L-alanine amidase